MTPSLLRIKKALFISLAVFCLASCKTIQQPQSVQQPLDYTDKDVIENEINNIRAFEETESTKALFRAYLLGDDEILEECKAIVLEQAKKAEQENDYSLAFRLYKSLASVEEVTTSEIEERMIFNCSPILAYLESLSSTS